ncbi:glycosyltransferase [Bacillus haynesii]|uniref:CgeB family protein n=1 Tax=Bacillus haynesii TaxID=1925021 RepID=UPI001593CC19|nr:glycosyltransferase [Bacillus haynesii]NVB34698.1 glycosyltransferase [Bacillus licheniformis]MCY7777342.1 glycosyltransferase [Bacillus haynesii]MEC0670311.1 glycosyltransferase [Bacillus haynesii]MEC1418077.1 glycosyltransferase [Bacillus haynesii]MEC1469141.1 glycosyltransferase [Bacillus haynesii]
MSNKIDEKLNSLYKQRALIESSVATSIAEMSIGSWYLPNNRNITVDENYKIKKGDSGITYLSFEEKNRDFSLGPNKNCIKLDKGTYYISFEGMKSEGIDAAFFVLFYNKQKEKVRTESLLLNESKSITLDNEEKFVRFAIRLKGKGFLDIKKLTVNNTLLWNNIKETKLKYIVNTLWCVPALPNIKYNKLNTELNFQLKNNQHIYLSYKELNENFDVQPEFPLELDEEEFFVSFKGEKDRTLDVNLSIIFYSHQKKICVEQIALNQNKKINVPKGSICARLAIRVAGSGSVKFENISIDGKEFWNPYLFPQNTVDHDVFDYNVKINMNMFKSKVDNMVTYNQEKDVITSYLIGEQYKHFYIEKIAFTDRDGDLDVKQKHIYEFFLGASIRGKLRLDLFVEGYDEYDRIEIHQIKANQSTKVQFNNNTKKIRLFFRLKGKGYITNLSLGINEKEVEYTQRLKVALDPKDWFYSKKSLLLTKKEDELIGEITKQTNQKQYLSYKENNNKFSIPPKNKLIDIKNEYKYEFYFRAQMSEGIELIPMIVGYANDKKIQVYQLKVNDVTFYKPQKNVNKIRITVRVGGSGEFCIEEFEIRESSSVSDNTTPEWITKREVEQMNLLPSKKISELKMAVIFDEFTRASFSEECKLIQFTPDNWLEVLTRDTPDILMVESAWNGNNGSWFKHVGDYGEEQNKDLFDLIKWCNAKNIPTVFWNKEDPVHYNRFINTAKKFDYIFTTDEDMVPFYKKEVGHENVYSLPFAAQPKIHNPIKIQSERINKACFAGSYYRLHEERSIDMDRILDIAKDFGLDIYDRNYEKTSAGLMPNHCFPEKYKENIKGSLKYYEIDKAYKGYKVMINVNTVKNSPTMFSRRVFEGLACGTPVISTYAKGVNNLLGDLVYISEDERDIKDAFQFLLNSEEHYRKKAMKGIREVLKNHTYTQRLNKIVDKIGLNFKSELPRVTVLGFANSEEEFHNLIKKFEKQTYQNKELCILIDLFPGYLELFNSYNNKNVKTFIKSYFHNYQNIKEWLNTPYCAYFSSNDYYGENYLLDLMLSTTFTDSEVIGKRNHFAYIDNKLVESHTNSEYEYVHNLKIASSVFKMDIFSKENLSDLLSDIEKGKDFSGYYKQGSRLFSNDKFNYVENGGSITAMEQLKQIEI